MTSLAGCSAEAFGTVLKSLGYVLDRRAGPAITVPLVPRASTEPVQPIAAVPSAEDQAGETLIADAPAAEAAAADEARDRLRREIGRRQVVGRSREPRQPGPTERVDRRGAGRWCTRGHRAAFASPFGRTSAFGRASARCRTRSRAGRGEGRRSLERPRLPSNQCARRRWPRLPRSRRSSKLATSPTRRRPALPVSCTRCSPVCPMPNPVPKKSRPRAPCPWRPIPRWRTRQPRRPPRRLRQSPAEIPIIEVWRPASS